MRFEGNIQTLLGRRQDGINPQGAPESPLVFVLITELVLRPLISRWKARGSGWRLDDFWLSVVCYADDILLISSCKEDLLRMMQEVREGFVQVGLDIGPEKTHWASYPCKEGECLEFQGINVIWEPTLTFVGTVLDFSDGDGKSVDYRIAQAHKALGRWRTILRCRQISCMKKATLVYKAVFAAVLWLF